MAVKQAGSLIADQSDFCGKDCGGWCSITSCRLMASWSLRDTSVSFRASAANCSDFWRNSCSSLPKFGKILTHFFYDATTAIDFSMVRK